MWFDDHLVKEEGRGDVWWEDGKTLKKKKVMKDILQDKGEKKLHVGLFNF